MKKDQILRVFGIMTGTSCDGLDGACLDVSNNKILTSCSANLPYPPTLRDRVFAFQKSDSSISLKDVSELHRDLGIWYGKCCLELMKKLGKMKSIDLIACHGQTVLHFPKLSPSGVTLQLGDASVISELTGLTVVSDFRRGDLAAGGEGAPLVPIFHREIAKQLGLKTGIAFHNLGGFSNLTYLGPKNEVLAFDTGPGNLFIDHAMEKITLGKLKFDESGKTASTGKVNSTQLGLLLSHPFLKMIPPKSTGRDEFSFEYIEETIKNWNFDTVTTVTEFTAMSIARAYQDFILKKKKPLREIYFCGGGAANSFLLKRIQHHLNSVAVKTVENLGLRSSSIEAQAFAYLAYLSLKGQPVGGAWTGAKSFGPPGQITPGKNWKVLIEKFHKVF